MSTEPKPGVPIVSVVVCTYNRADLLPDCLESLAAQTVDKARFEVIVVDNNCTDATPEIAASFVAREPNVRIVGEAVQGLSNARNRGWKEARGEYVAYIDDDARAEADWVERALSIAEERSPHIFGGAIYPFYLSEKPRWFKDAYEIRRTTEHPMELKEMGYISGSNIVFRRALLEFVGGFDPDLGMKGDQLSYGEETALIVHVRESLPDALIYYHPDLRVKHLTPATKMRVRYFLRSRFQIGLESPSFRIEEEGERLRAAIHLPWALFLVLFQLLWRTGLRSRVTYPYWQNYVVERVAPLFGQLGRCLALLRAHTPGPNPPNAATGVLTVPIKAPRHERRRTQ